jgi:hypothetical protein
MLSLAKQPGNPPGLLRVRSPAPAALAFRHPTFAIRRIFR